MPYKTTLGAEFAPSELDQVRAVAQAVRDRVAALPLDCDPNDYWSLATMIVDQGFTLRGAIERISREANDRAFRPKKWDRSYIGPGQRPKADLADRRPKADPDIVELLKEFK